MFGVHTALVTPFTEQGRIDFSCFERLLARQLVAGIHGVVPCGTTGEAPTLTDAEWKDLVSLTIRFIDGRIPVTAGVGTNATTTTVAKCETAAALGVTAGLLVLPYYNKPNAAGLRAHVKAALSPGLPLVLYHVPGRTGQRIDAVLLAELASYPGVIAVKEATGDIRYGTDVILNTMTPVLSGDDFSFLGLLAQGGTGVISVVSNVDPAGTVAIYEKFRSGNRQEAQYLLKRLWKLIDFLFADTNPVPTKIALAALGLCRFDARLPLVGGTLDAPRGLLAELGLT